LAWVKGQVPLINNTNGGIGMERDADYSFLLNGPSGLRLYYTQFNSSLAGQPIPIRIEMANCPNSLLPFFLQTTTTTETITKVSTQMSLTTATSTVVATATETLSNTSTITTVQTESYLSPVDDGLIAAGVLVLALAVVILSKSRLPRGR
jgi:carbohydrate-binding DOMON domain-containing protein